MVAAHAIALNIVFSTRESRRRNHDDTSFKVLSTDALTSPPQGETGPRRVAVVRSKQTFPQQQLAKTLGLDELANHKT